MLMKLTSGGYRWRNPSGEIISGKFCNLRLEAVVDRDVGEWSCMTSSTEDAAKVFYVALALEPADVRLEAVAERSEVRCVVTKARPRPEFSWYLDNVIIENMMTKDFEGKELYSGYCTIQSFWIVNPIQIKNTLGSRYRN